MTPKIVPSPPYIETPPITTSVSTGMRSALPTSARAEPTYEERRIPTMPAANAVSMYAPMSTASERKPAYRAATGFAPMSLAWRPNVVRLSRMANRIAKTIKTISMFGSPNVLPPASAVNSSGSPETPSNADTPPSPEAASARPANKNCVPSVITIGFARVTMMSTPFRSPAKSAAVSPTTTATQIFAPDLNVTPMMIAASDAIEAKLMSMPPVIMTIPSGRAMMPR